MENGCTFRCEFWVLDRDDLTEDCEQSSVFPQGQKNKTTQINGKKEEPLGWIDDKKSFLGWNFHLRPSWPAARTSRVHSIHGSSKEKYRNNKTDCL